MSVLDDLEATIQSRRGADPEQSWTAKLLSDGKESCAKKFGEEAVEAVLAGVGGDTDDLVHEAADVIYHLLVLLAANDVPFDAVIHELERRSQSSGIEEKRNRPHGNTI